MAVAQGVEDEPQLASGSCDTADVTAAAVGDALPQHPDSALLRLHGCHEYSVGTRPLRVRGRILGLHNRDPVMLTQWSCVG